MLYEEAERETDSSVLETNSGQKRRGRDAETDSCVQVNKTGTVGQTGERTGVFLDRFP